MPRPPNSPAEDFGRLGFAVLPMHEDTRRWAEAARGTATPIVESEAARAAWLRCEGTWFAGVDVLPNAADGAVSGVPLAGPALDLLEALDLRPGGWHRAQVSVVYPGYPRPREGESAGAARYRREQDAAHVDGLLPVGPARRRMLREPHAFILGLPLNEVPEAAAPLAVWPGAHRRIGAALRRARAAFPDLPARDVDLTDSYQAARREVFQQERRQLVPVVPGQAILLHRHMLHGISPWSAPPNRAGRMMAYFRPELRDFEAWFSP